MSSKTITLDGSEVRANFHGTNAWLRNDGTSTIYAGKQPDVVSGADGVVSVPAGGSAPVFDAHGTVYLIGTGSVLLIGSDYSENPFKSSAQSGGSGADEVARAAIEAHAGNTSVHLTAEQLNNAVDEVKAYADEKDDETLAAAKTYADGLAMSGGGVAQTYVDEKDAETLSAAQSYADSAAQSAVTSAKAYTEQYSAKSAHTHTVSDITDFPDIPTGSSGVTEEQLSEAVEAHNTNVSAHSGMFAEPEHTHTVSDISDFPEIPSAGVTEEQLAAAVTNHNTDSAAHAGIFAAENHTHTKSEITDFPESLPANGGNADTVNNHTVEVDVPADAEFTDTVYTHPTYTARTGVPTANQTPAFGGSFSVSQPVSDASGHITGMNNRTVTIPSTSASASAAGLVSTGSQTFAGQKTFNGSILASGASSVTTAQARNIYAGTSDMTAGTTALTTGTIYLVYE